jgi:hypothetical protein
VPAPAAGRARQEPPPAAVTAAVRPAAPSSGPRLAAPRAAGAPASAEHLPEARLRQLYSQYLDAKRRHNESTAAISYDAVARSLRESSAKLREKHGRAVDFEVAEKDGKAILRPVLK